MILTQKQVARVITKTKIYNMQESIQQLQDYGVEKFSYLFNGKIKYINFGEYEFIPNKL